MKKMIRAGILAAVLFGFISISVAAQEGGPIKRSIGPAGFYLSVKDKIGITKEQEEQLTAIETEALKKLDEITPALIRAQQLLANLTREEEIDLAKTKEVLKSMGILDMDAKYTMIEATALEKKVLSKEQRQKAEEIARGMSKGLQAPPAPPAKK